MAMEVKSIDYCIQIVLNFQPQLGPELLSPSKAVVKGVVPHFTTFFIVAIK